MSEQSELPSMWAQSEDGIVNPYASANPMSWQDYERLRPTYPTKLYNFVDDYMKQHNQTDRQLCIDYGSGTGLIVPSLLEICGIRKVLGTDISPRQLEEGLTRIQSRFGPDRYEIRVGAAGELDSIPDSRVDLITAAESCHWFEKEKWFKEVARILKPSGTLAIWYYLAEPYIISHPDATPVITKMWERYFKVTLPEGFIRRELAVDASAMMDSYVIDHPHLVHQKRQKWVLPNSVQSRRDRHPLDYMIVPPADESERTKGLRATPDLVMNTSTPQEPSETLLQDTNWTIKTMLEYIAIVGFPTEKGFADPVFQKCVKEIEAIVGGPEATFDVGWPCTLMLCTRA